MLSDSSMLGAAHRVPATQRALATCGSGPSWLSGSRRRPSIRVNPTDHFDQPAPERQRVSAPDP